VAETGLTVDAGAIQGGLVAAGPLGLGILLVLERLNTLEASMANMEQRLGESLTGIKSELAGLGTDLGRVEGLVQQLRDAVAAAPDLTDELALADEALSGLRGARGRLQAVAPEVTPPPVAGAPEA
jgi:hypothetical protein